ncbi:hypothetical protein [Cryptosporidium parvum Iowa II]|uniref:Uncharacterized protein n=2 Tax=Cryptosporidium parvum TaxID=5807 RepID=Q5CQG3_CRYPI|nr:hypothetical protein [Cryptosporidium parvum Iowa II]EAK87653.1 hypothetical protein cgd4_830 [Cryptosporidium parvum Iowa II]QOY41974.1 Uncharacterized protein CPATCC_0017970 [Cryptosporidium parvum]WKS77277.1 hypothetical protein CPCDC_4g830 [Cryptosporidium sp. 43IA8]WRK32054.1 Uncharacterized protein cpbgf_400830 [Cryptosporidium parvum]|eukprot:QOY41974.1 hypothetical protein CPATCC_001566 [Cryptosporidium parvum]
MSKDEELALRKSIRKYNTNERALQKIQGDVLERLRRATELENPYQIKTNRKKQLDQTKYENNLSQIICQDYYPDLDYMNKNKDDHESIKSIINNPPGTLNMNDFPHIEDYESNKDLLVCKKLPNITQFQSKYTHKGHLDLLALTNQDLIQRREKESWIEHQSFNHNLKREMNIIQMNQKNSNQINDFDEKSLIFNKSQSRSNFMFPNHNHHNQLKKEVNTPQDREKLINPSNTRYNYMDDFEKDERMLLLKEIQTKRKQIHLDKAQNLNPIFLDNKKTSKNLLMKSPLVKNALRRLNKSDILFDNQLRDSYSYKGNSKQSLSRIT